MKIQFIPFVAVIAIAAFAAPTVVLAQGTKAAVGGGNEPAGFDPKRDPAKDVADAVVLAKKQNKRILLDVGGEWCPWCHKLNKMFKTDADVAKALKDKFIVVKVNYSQENKNEKFLSQYPKISGYPHIFVLEKDGKFLHSQDTGLLETGDHHDHDKVMTFLKKWAL